MELGLQRKLTVYGVPVDIELLSNYYAATDGFDRMTPLEGTLYSIKGVTDVDVSAHWPFVFLSIDDEEDNDCTHEKVRQAIRTHLFIPG